MKDNYLQLTKNDDRQTNFRSKCTVENKKSQKTSKQCIDYVTELDDRSLNNPIDNIDESSSSEIINGSQILETTANDFMESTILAASSSSSSPSTTDESGKIEFISISSSNLDNVRSKFLEVDMMVSNLRQAEAQVLNSTDVDNAFKFLLYALVEMVIEELNRMPGDKDKLPEIVSRKTHILLLSLATCIFVAFMILLFSNGASGNFIQVLPPT